MKRIVFLTHKNEGPPFHYWIQRLKEACERQGVETELLDLDEGHLRLEIDRLCDDPPDLLCSFSGIRAFPSGERCWDHMRIPYLSLLVDPAIYVDYYRRSPYSILSCIDRGDLPFLQRHGFSSAFFLPLGAEGERPVSPAGERTFEVALIGNFTDHELLEKECRARFSPHVCQILDEVITAVLTAAPAKNVPSRNDPEGALFRRPASPTPREGLPVSCDKKSRASVHLARGNFLAGTAAVLSDHIAYYPSLLAERLVGLGAVPFDQICYAAHYRLRGLDRLRLLQSLKGVDVHLFGEFPEKWRAPHIHLHGKISYVKALQVMSQSKILLNSAPFFPDGLHDRVTAGLMQGSLILSSESCYQAETLRDGESILTYRPGDYASAGAKVHAYLADERKRQELVRSGQEVVRLHHTWDVRARQMLAALPPILRGMQ